MMLENECKGYLFMYASLNFPVFLSAIFLPYIVPLSNQWIAGVSHGDEIGYLFHTGMLELDLDPSSLEFKILSRMVKLWTNFAKSG
jgi:hypothetical protein